MISFKTFLNIRYPEWENEKLVFVPQRPNIDSLYQASTKLNDTPDIMTKLYKLALVKQALKGRT